MIYAVDFDGTLQLKDGSANTFLISQLIQLQHTGNPVVLYTSRTGQRLQIAVNWCAAHGLFLNGVYGGKPVADVYIDDKAVNPFGNR